jgi:hypothetical protein
MDWKEPKANVAVKLPRDLHRAVRTKATASGITAEQAYQEALEAWLAGAQAATSSASDELPPADREAHTLLQLILGEDAKAADWIKGNLRMFAEAIRSRSGKPGSRRKAS